MDAALYDPAAGRQPGQRGRSRLKGKRQPTLTQRLEDRSVRWHSIVVAQWYDQKDKKVHISSGVAVWYHSGMTPVEIKWVIIKDKESNHEPVALLSTNLHMSAEQIISLFIRRWSMEVTFKEVRTHLGVETQRQWSDQAIACTTLSLMGLLSIVTLWADKLYKSKLLDVQGTAWYKKEHPTFSDALAAVRKQLWKQKEFCMSNKKCEMIKIPTTLFNELTTLLARAA